MRNILVVFCFLLLPVQAGAEGYFYSSGYKIRAIATLDGSELRLAGRVNNGASCRVLKVTGILMNSDGRRLARSARIEDVGLVNRLFESDPIEVPAVRNGWRVEEVRATCVGK